MILGAVPMAVLFFGIFWPPAGLSEFSLFLWFTIMSVLMRTAHTLFQVPYMSLGVRCFKFSNTSACRFLVML